MTIKAGLFWICDADEWLVQAATLLAEQTSHPALQITCFFRQESGAIQALPVVCQEWPYASINALTDVYDMACMQGLDYAIISFGRGIPIDLGLLQHLLGSSALQSCVWSIRTAEISGVGMQNPPRLPFVDDHFIILNVRRAQERKFFQRKLTHASHFSSAGHRHAELASMIEYALGKDELNNHFVAHASRNQYGQAAKLTPLPFHLCEATGFLTCYPEFRSSLSELLKRNLYRLQPGSEQRPTLRYVLKGGYWYFRFAPWLKILVRSIRKATHDIGKYEFKKRFEQERK